MDPSLVQAALTRAANGGDEGLFTAYRKRFEEAKSPTERTSFLIALGAFREPAIREKALQYALEGPVRPDDFFQIAGRITSTEEGRGAVFQWMMANHDILADRLPPMIRGYLPMYAGGCSPERIEAARTFFADPAHQVAGTEKNLVKAAEQVTNCVNLRRREGKIVADYLEKLAN